MLTLVQFSLSNGLDGYRRLYLSWTGDEGDPDQSVTVAELFGDPPVPLCDDKDLLEALLERGWLLFFQMHEPLANQTVLWIDGTRELSGDFDIGVADRYGFLVDIRNGTVSLYPALYDGSSDLIPSLDLQAHYSFLGEKMMNVVQSCVRSE